MLPLNKRLSASLAEKLQTPTCKRDYLGFAVVDLLVVRLNVAVRDAPDEVQNFF